MLLPLKCKEPINSSLCLLKIHSMIILTKDTRVTSKREMSPTEPSVTLRITIPNNSNGVNTSSVNSMEEENRLSPSTATKNDSSIFRISLFNNFLFVIKLLRENKIVKGK